MDKQSIITLWLASLAEMMSTKGITKLVATGILASHEPTLHARYLAVVKGQDAETSLRPFDTTATDQYFIALNAAIKTHGLTRAQAIRSLKGTKLFENHVLEGLF